MSIIRLKQLAGLVINEGLTSITQQSDEGSLEGYVVDTTQEQLRNYLRSQSVDERRIALLQKDIDRIGIIKNLWVDEDHRNQGIGNDLMSMAIDDAQHAGAEAIILVADLGEQNEFDIIKWYEDFGFQIIDKAGSNYLMIL